MVGGKGELSQKVSAGKNLGTHTNILSRDSGRKEKSKVTAKKKVSLFPQVNFPPAPAVEET